ncbi:MAG: pyocin knob domain-containing S74 family peptidase, partial [Methylophagaceae bacterium]
ATSATTATTATTASNAMLLDGIDSTKFVSGTNANKINDSTNFNNSVPSGFYQSDTASNMPGSSWHNMINIRHSNTGNDHGFQIAASYYNEQIYTRTYSGGSGANNGTFTTWAKQWHDRNDGAGSGLDADTVDGIQGASFLRSDAADTFTGQLSVGSTDARRAGIYCTYDSNRIVHIWSMGTGYMIPSNGSDFGNLYGLAYKHTNNTTGGTMAGGHQMVWADNGTGRSAMGYNGFWTTGNGYKVDDGSYGSCTYGAYYGNILLDGGATGTNSYYVGIPSNTSAQTLYVGGPILADGDVTAFYSSDRRLKENIKPIENSLDKIKKLNGVTFDWIKLTEEEKGVKHQYNEGSDLGVIAQEVEEVLPELVKTRKSGYKAVDYQKFTAVLIEAVKDQQTQIDELKDLVSKLQKNA